MTAAVPARPRWRCAWDLLLGRALVIGGFLVMAFPPIT